MVKEVIATGGPVGQAFGETCKLFGAESHEAEFGILELPEKGKFGLFGGVPVKVYTFIRSDPAEAAAGYLGQVLGQMGIPSVEITVAEQEDGALLTLTGDDIGFIIGHRGETLDSLQYLSGLMVNHVEDFYYRITLDIGNYREKRRETLEALDKKMATKALKTQCNCSLRPVSPYERRIIYTVVWGIEGIKSWNEGEDLARHVVTGPEGGERPAFHRPNNHSSRGDKDFRKDRDGRPQGGNRNFGGRSPSRDSRSRRPAQHDRRGSYSQPADSRPVKKGNNLLYSKIETKKES